MLSLRSIARRAPALALAATLLTSGVGPPPAPTLAASTEPVARLMVQLHSLKILDENEGIGGGDGEMRFTFRIVRCNEGVPAPCLGEKGDHEGASQPIGGLTETFSADKNDVKPLPRLLPTIDGFEVIPGREYVIRFDMYEQDGTLNDDDYMGRHIHIVDAGANGLGIGPNTARSSWSNGEVNGDYEVNYEIVQVTMPDLQPTGIKVQDVPGSAKKKVCMTVQNVGTANAGPYNVSLFANRTSPPDGSAVGTGGLAQGATEELCVQVDLPAGGPHELSAVVDISKTVPESNEGNNSFLQQYTNQPTAAIDLTVGEVTINGRVPDGKNDCKDGKNDVVVLVKNTGTTNAGAFVVQLTVDNPQGNVEQSVTGLEAGKELEVRFDDAKLK